jgi:hypothetical protein
VTDKKYAWKHPLVGWVEIDREMELPLSIQIGAVRDDGPWMVSPEHIATLHPQTRKARGFVEIEETEPPQDYRVIKGVIEDPMAESPRRGWKTEPFTHEEKVRLREDVIEMVKAEANSRILWRYPLWMQANMQKRATWLVDKRIDGPLTEAEEAERLELKAASDWIDAVRAASNALEAQAPSRGAMVELKEFAGAISTHDLWPD